MRPYLLLAACLVGGVVASCVHDGSGAKPSDPNLITANGTVRWMDLEGGFFGLVADDSTKYDPGTLPAEFRTDGLRVRFRARKTGAMTIRMWGTAVDVEHIEKL